MKLRYTDDSAYIKCVIYLGIFVLFLHVFFNLFCYLFWRVKVCIKFISVMFIGEQMEGDCLSVEGRPPTNRTLFLLPYWVRHHKTAPKSAILCPPP